LRCAWSRGRSLLRWWVLQPCLSLAGRGPARRDPSPIYNPPKHKTGDAPAPSGPRGRLRRGQRRRRIHRPLRPRRRRARRPRADGAAAATRGERGAAAAGEGGAGRAVKGAAAGGEGPGEPGRDGRAVQERPQAVVGAPGGAAARGGPLQQHRL